MNHTEKNKSLRLIIVLVDAAITALSAVLAFLIRYSVILGTSAQGDQLWIFYLMIAASVLMGLIVDFSKYFVRRGPLAELVQDIKRQALVTVGIIVFVYLAHRGTELSRLVIAYFSVIDLALTFIAHLLIKAYLLNVYKNGRDARHVILLVGVDNAEKVICDFSGGNNWDINIGGVAVWADDPPAEINGTAIVANKKTFLEYATRQAVDEVLISVGEEIYSDDMQLLMTQLVEMGVSVDADIDLFYMDVPGKKDIAHVGKYGVVSIVKNVYPAFGMFCKRAFDIIGGIIGCVFLGLISIFLVPAIKLDSRGPAIYVSTRVGKNGRHFKFYKFRSMCADADAKKKDLMDKNEVSGLMFKMDDDPRITRVGKFIRKTSLDEFPQFINVLKGDMSLVGTRPPTIDEFEQYTPIQKARLSLRPGITGMWQVSGRSDIKDFDEVVRLDMLYLDEWSFLLDIKILFKTVLQVLKHEGSK